MLLSIYQILDVCKVDALAKRAADYDQLCRQVSEALKRYRAAQKDSSLYYATTNTHRSFSVDADAVCWLFLLLNPSHAFLRRLDAQRSDLLERARALNPDDYVSGTGYHYDHVADALHCTRRLGIYITQSWEILPVYRDRAKAIIDLDYLMSKSTLVRRAEEVYMLYTACTREKAERVFQKHLAKKAGALTALYPDGKIERRDGMMVIEIPFSASNTAKKETWQKLPHPFFQAHSKSPEKASALFFDYLIVSIYRYVLSTADLYPDRHIEYQGYLTSGTEKAGEIRFIRRETYSSHDGSGSSVDSLYFRAVPKQEQPAVPPPDKLMTKPCDRGHDMPPCTGYWYAQGVTYVKEPFAMDGVFIMEAE